MTTIDNISPTSTVMFAGCISTYPKASGATAVPARTGDQDLTSTTISGPVTMWGQPIEVAFQRRDLSLYTTSTPVPITVTQSDSRSTSTSDTATPNSATATFSPVTSPISVSRKSNGFSSGAKAGIGLGVAGIILCVMGFAFFLLWRRRQGRKHRAQSEEQHMGVPFNEAKEKEGPYYEEAKGLSQPVEVETLPFEVDSTARAELPDRAEQPIAELESTEHLSRRHPAMFR